METQWVGWENLSACDCENRLQIACDVQEHEDSRPNQRYYETKVPAVQAEQVEDDVAPMTAEYFPA